MSRPSLLPLGGFSNFTDYQKRFTEEYCKEPLYDVRGKRVIFGHPRFNNNDDCAHAVWGTPASRWYKEKYWDEKVQIRAERLLWIKAALIDPKVNIRLSKDGVYPKSESHVYMWVARSDEATVPDEYFVVITIDGKIIKDDSCVIFLTSYDVTLTEFQKKKQDYKCIWPEPAPSKPSSRSKKK